jgi:hypothetical protein
MFPEFIPALIFTAPLIVLRIRYSVFFFFFLQILERVDEPYDLPPVLAVYHPAWTELFHLDMSNAKDVLSTRHIDETQENSINTSPQSSGISKSQKTELKRREKGTFGCVLCQKEFSTRYNSQ